MDARRWLAGSIGLCCCMVAGCGLDDRLLTLARSRLGGDAGPGGDAGLHPALAPRLEVAPSGIDLGLVTTGYPARARLAVRNAGTAPLPAPKVGWASGSNADLVLIQNRCDRDVPPGDSCELRVQLVPSQPGDVEGTLQVQSGSDAFNVAVTARGAAAGDLILAPGTGSFEDYGGVLVGTPHEGTFILSNPTSQATGALALEINRPEFALVTPGPGECASGASLAPAEACNLRIAFTPAERGVVDAVLTIASDVAGSVSLTVAGRGLAPGAMAASSMALDFEDVLVGQSAKRTVTFTNGGDEQVELAGASLQPADAEGFTIQDSNCGPATLLEGGQSCSVDVEFRPPNADAELTAQLVAADIGAEAPLAVSLRGTGLLPGALTLAPPSPGEDDFGDVLVGESLERTFQVANPGSQPSGPLELSTTEGFALAPSPGDGECVTGTTSIVNGETCNVRVLFSPSKREAANGSLTVKSPLAGTVGLALSGRGIVPAQIEAEPEMNFGRVLRAASARRALKLTNTGDQPLAPPAFEVTSNDPAQGAAFSVEPGCTDPIEAGADCEVEVAFAPQTAVPHAASVNITSGSSTATVLLLGEALEPGSLVLAPAPDSSAAFGDVEIGTTVTKAFTLSNPGAVPSGPVTITTDNNRFQAALGDCNQGDPSGLVDGASCSFSVAFSPADSQAAAANVSVQSPGAGRAGIALSGRGRTKAALSGAGTRDFGRVVIGSSEPSPTSQFSWTVTNTGDLPTGMLAVTNDNSMEFVIAANQCQGVALAGKATCQLAISFRPGDTERRTGTITVRDPTGMSTAALAVSGTGVRLAKPGQSCRDSDCETGECTRPALVCCDRACDTCEECSPGGTCIEQATGTACGAPTSGSQCFGANACKLPSGSKCVGDGAAGDAQCGLGHCEVRLGGADASDRICCDVACEGATACTADGTGCELPALGAGEACDPQASRCGAGMDCTLCRGTGRPECTPRGQCCSSCAGDGFQCFPGGECACVADDGSAGRLCVSGDCVPRVGACCPEDTQACSGGLPVCHATRHVCTECDDPSDCTGEPRPGATAFCTAAGVCEYPCADATPKDCGATCVAESACCETCQGDQICRPDGSSCGTPCTAGATRCSNGRPQVCTNGFFADAAACSTGQECDPGTGVCVCSGGLTLCDEECVDTNTDERHCTICDAPCPGTTQCEGGRCLAPVGGECGADRSCVSGLNCATNGLCCTAQCSGPCQACDGSTDTCNNLDSAVACLGAVTCPDDEVACSGDPLVTRTAPVGEGVCVEGRCATAEEICRQPFEVGTECLTLTGEPGRCNIGRFGGMFCELSLQGPVLGESCANGEVCAVGTCATNGICCSVSCGGQCEACTADGGQCNASDSNPDVCGTVDCSLLPQHDAQCSVDPVIPNAVAGQCFNGNCAGELQVCRQPVTSGTPCDLLDVQDGICAVDFDGATRCLLP